MSELEKAVREMIEALEIEAGAQIKLTRVEENAGAYTLAELEAVRADTINKICDASEAINAVKRILNSLSENR